MGLIALFGVLFWVMIFIAYVLLLSAVYKYATRLGQERVTWVVISLICNGFNNLWMPVASAYVAPAVYNMLVTIITCAIIR